MMTVLFVCEDNALLGPLAETYTNVAGNGVLRAFSAGIFPAEKANPSVSAVLARHGLSIPAFEPKSIDIFLMPHAPIPDRIICLESGLDSWITRRRLPLDLSRLERWDIAGFPADVADQDRVDAKFRHLTRRVDDLLQDLPVIVPAA